MATPVRFDDLVKQGGKVDAAPGAAPAAAVSFDDLVKQGGTVAAPAPVPVPATKYEEPGFWETIRDQYLAGYSKNYSDEAAGKKARLDPALQMRGAALKMPDGSVRFIDNPDQAEAAVTERARQKLESERQAHPWLSTGMNVLGDMAGDFSVYGLSGGAIPVGSLPYQVASGALSGAGAADDHGIPGGRAGGAGLGASSALVGAGLGRYVVGPAITHGSRIAGEGLQRLGINFGRKALLNGADSLSRNITPDEAVREALRFGPHGEAPAILPMGTAGGAYRRLEGRVDDLGSIYGDIVQRLEAEGVQGPEARALADQMVNRAAEENLATGANKSVPNLFMREAQNVENLANPQTGRLGLTQGEAIKRDLQAQARADYHKTGPGTPIGNARKEVASLVRQANEDAVEAAGRAAPPNSEVSELAESFAPVKQRLSRTIQARDAAERGAQKGANRSWLGLAGKMALASGNPTQMAGALASGGGMMNRLSSTAASTAYGLGAASRGASGLMSQLPAHTGQVLGGVTGREGADLVINQAPTPIDNIKTALATNPAALGKFAPTLQNAAQRGGNALSTTHYVLMQSSPEYRKMVEGGGED